jgi:hypothetical protein
MAAYPQYYMGHAHATGKQQPKVVVVSSKGCRSLCSISMLLLRLIMRELDQGDLHRASGRLEEREQVLAVLVVLLNLLGEA